MLVFQTGREINKDSNKNIDYYLINRFLLLQGRCQLFPLGISCDSLICNLQQNLHLSIAAADWKFPSGTGEILEWAKQQEHALQCFICYFKRSCFILPIFQPTHYLSSYIKALEKFMKPQVISLSKYCKQF